MKARDAILTVLDFESTGAVRGLPDEPWQAGMVEMREGRVTGHFHESYLRVAAGRPFNPYAPGRHAELRGVLASAPALSELWPVWKPWLEGRPLAAHNIGTERKFLLRAAPLHQLGPWVDTLRLARRVRPDLEGHSLREVAEALGIAERTRGLCPGRDWHDALFDAFASALILEHCLDLPGWQDVSIEALSTAV
ncbi:MAG TPA: 3'-5' exonuclease [Kiritimatiellia bacterium]|nr:3'-5' exonuclease [Kiritimatiellia bacterium]HPJ56630.1 3'-5' exonuclease [Kiritimatiellia bacterium]HPR68635.1 3'-5' exonuclease [Kiritimatiellia bacterium]HRX06338.1 3'-5' exonuclease [Kiritimatiellia bacterium]